MGRAETRPSGATVRIKGGRAEEFILTDVGGGIKGGEESWCEGGLAVAVQDSYLVDKPGVEALRSEMGGSVYRLGNCAPVVGGDGNIFFPGARRKAGARGDWQ